MVDHRGTVLVVEDESSMRSLLEMALGRAGYAITVVSSAEEALEKLKDRTFDVILSDLRLPGMDGLELLRTCRSRFSSTQFVLMTAYATVESAMEAVREGAFDYIKKPFKLEELELTVWRALEQSRLMDEHRRLKEMASGYSSVVAHSPKMARVLEIVRRVADSKAAVLVTGPSGAGKELVAKLLHRLSSRSENPFIPVNCGAIPENLLESELFGYEKGAFTGADTSRPGLFQAASGGTLFLDEIGELPMHLQVKLLRAIQEKTVRPVGSVTEVPVDVRIIAATNRDLREEISAGRFREDLFYRLNVINIDVPSLDERREDIPDLVHILLENLSREAALPVPVISDSVMNYLMSRKWPGNVRELENTLERALALDEDGVITMEDLGLEDVPSAGETQHPMTLDERLALHEKEYITEALEATGWNRTKAAKLLGISFRSLRYRMEKLGIG